MIYLMKPLMRYLLQYEERVWIAKVREDDSRSLTEVFGEGVGKEAIR